MTGAEGTHLDGSAFHARYISSAYTDDVPDKKLSAPCCTSEALEELVLAFSPVPLRKA